MGIMRKIEDVLQSLYTCFFHNPKKTKEFVDLVAIVETRGQQILRNIKIHYNFMLLSIKKDILSIVPWF